MRYNCIKPSCTKQYTSDDDEAYYCLDCRKAKREIAAQIDAQFSTKTHAPVTSELQAFEASARVFKDPNTGRDIYFARA